MYKQPYLGDGLKKVSIVDGKAIITDKPSPPTAEEMLEMVKELNSLEHRLKTKGYTMVRKLGEGCTADSFLVEYNSGPLKGKLRVAKVPKDEVDGTSVTSLVNNSKGDQSVKEILANKTRHNNIIEIFDAFTMDVLVTDPVTKMPCDRTEKTVLIEEYNEGAIDLQKFVEKYGPCTDTKKFSRIFAQLIDAMEFLHSPNPEIEKKAILHRDIKPSNILIQETTHGIKLADFQNACELENIIESALPTRGGTAFTELNMLDAFLKGSQTKASLRSEIYALGTTMYYVLTGRNLFDFELKCEENTGKEIEINGKKVSYIFRKDGKSVDCLDLIALDKEAKQKMKNVPRGYRKFLYNMLSPFSTKYRGTDVKQMYAGMKKDLAECCTTYWDIAKKVLPYFLPATIAVTLLGATVKHEINVRNEQHNAEIRTLLKADDKIIEDLVKGKYNAEEFKMGQNEHANDLEQEGTDFNRRRLEAEDMLENAVKKYSEFIGPSENLIEKHCPKEHRRLLYSIIRSVLSDRRFEGNYDNATGGMDCQRFYPFVEDRFPVTLLPDSFVIEQTSNKLGINATEEEINKACDESKVIFAHECIPMAVKRLTKAIETAKYSRNKLSVGEASVEDIITGYFGEPCLQDLLERKPASRFYSQKFSDMGITSVIKGYGSSLPPEIRNLISRAFILYCATDDDGNLDFSRIDEGRIVKSKGYDILGPASVCLRSEDPKDDVSTEKKD